MRRRIIAPLLLMSATILVLLSFSTTQTLTSLLVTSSFRLGEDKLTRQIQCEVRGAHYYVGGDGECRVVPGIEFTLIQTPPSATTSSQATFKRRSPFEEGSKYNTTMNNIIEDPPAAKFVERPATFTTFLHTYVPDVEGLSEKFERYSPEGGGRRWLAAYLTFIYRSSWLLPSWADFTEILRAPLTPQHPPLASSRPNTTDRNRTKQPHGNSATTSSHRKITASYSGREGMGLFTIKNFCVTLDGRLLAPPGDTHFKKRIKVFNSVDEHRNQGVTKFSSNAFLEQVAPFPTSNISSFSFGEQVGRHRQKNDVRSPPFLSGKVLIMPMDGFSPKFNTGHMFHRSVSLNQIRKDLNPVLMLTVPDLIIPFDLHNESVMDISKKYFGQGSCDEELLLDSRGVANVAGNSKTCGLKRAALSAHHEVLGIPIATVSVVNIGVCRGNAACIAQRRNLNRKMIHAATMDMDDSPFFVPPSSLQPRRRSPFETERDDAFICFEEGYFYHNNRQGLGFPVEEQHALHNESFMFKAAREVNHSRFEYTSVSAHLAKTTSAFTGAATRSKQKEEATNSSQLELDNDSHQQHPDIESSHSGEVSTSVNYTKAVESSSDSNSAYLLSNGPTTTPVFAPGRAVTLTSSERLLHEIVEGGVDPWRYAFGQRTSASIRKGKMLRDIKKREIQLAATKPPVLVESMVAGNIVTAPLFSSQPSSYPSDEKAKHLSVLFSVRSGPRRIPYFSAFVRHMSKAFPFLRFQFVEESPRAFRYNLHPRLAMQSDILIGVHGALLTNVAYLPGPSNMSFSDRGGVLVELSSRLFTKTISPQVSTFGTIASSLGIPMAKVKYLASRYFNNLELANHSVATVLDTVALGVCMWCEHNYQNPHQPEGSNTRRKHPPEWHRTDIQSAGIFDTLCGQGAFGTNVSRLYPLPARHWERCCACVFGVDTYLRHGLPLLQYDVPIAPIIDWSAPKHIADTETVAYFRRSLLTTIVSYALLPTTTFVDGNRVSNQLVDIVVTFAQNCERSRAFRSAFVSQLANVSLKGDATSHNYFNFTSSTLDPSNVQKMVQAKKLSRRFAKQDYIKTCGAALFIIKLLDSAVGVSLSSSATPISAAGVEATVLRLIVHHQAHLAHVIHPPNTGDRSRIIGMEEGSGYNVHGLVRSIRSFANNYCDSQ